MAVSLATAEKIQTLQRKLYLKAKREPLACCAAGWSTSTGWVVAGSADSPHLTYDRLGFINLAACL